MDNDRQAPVAPGPLRILILEDSPQDAELEQRALARDGLTVTALRVETRAAFTAALRDFRPQVVLADYKVPGFGGPAALEFARANCPDIPVIVVSGSLGDERAVDLVKAGAADYVLKDNIVRLAPAVRRAVEQAAERARRRESDAQLRLANLLIEQSPAVLFRWIAAPGWPVAYVSENVRQWGYEPADLLAGKPSFASLVHPDDLQRVGDEVAAHSASGAMRFAQEYRIIKRSGDIIWVDDRATVERDVTGTPVFYQGVVTDVTASKRAELALRENEQTLRSITSAAMDAVILTGNDGRIAFWSDAAERIFGYSRAEAIGRERTLLIPEREHAAFLQRFQQLRDAGTVPFTSGRTETLAQRKGGEEFPAELSLSPIRLKEAWNAVEIVRDLTEQKHQQAVLGRAQRALRTLSAGNSAVVHAESEEQLLRTMCEVVTSAGYALVSIAFPDHGPDQTLRLVAWQGFGGDFLPQMSATWGDTEQGCGPTGRCIRTGQVQVIHDIASDPGMAPCRESALQHGFRAAAAFPLQDRNGVFGAITIFASEQGAFDVDEMTLLSEMAGDLAYGITHLRTREGEREAVEKSRMLARFPEESPSAVMRLDEQGVLLYANPASHAFLQGCGGGLGRPAPAACSVMAHEALASGAVKEEELQLGDSLYAVTFAPIAEARYVNVYAADVTARRRAEQTLRASLIATVQAIAATVETRDPYTAGHQRRVAAIAGAIARELGWDEERVRGLELAATIHDVGKINVPAEILAKPAKLTAAEYELVKVHAQAGYEILKGVEFPWPIAEMIRQHHERLDGSGYPRGLKTEQILPEAKVLAVADIVEATASHRPYRPAKGLDTALDEIEKGRGTVLDATAVDTCVKLFRENGFRIPD